MALDDIIAHYPIDDKGKKFLQVCYDYANIRLHKKFRKTGGSFMRHPENVMGMLADRRVDYRALAAAINHDTIEEIMADRIKQNNVKPLKEIAKDEIKLFDTYLKSRLGKESGKERLFVVDLVSHLTNTEGVDYISYIKSLFKIRNKEKREMALMIKAADMIDNMVDIGKQDYVTVSSNLRQDIYSAGLRIGRKIKFTKKLLHQLPPYESFSTFKSWVTDLYDEFASGVKKNGIKDGIKNWFNTQGFLGTEINKRGFKNLCFAYILKDYVRKQGYLPNGARGYNPMDNMCFMFRRLCYVSYHELMGLRGRIEGVARRPGNRNLNAALRQVQWQLCFEEISEDTFVKRTHARQSKAMSLPKATYGIKSAQPSTSMVHDFENEMELEKRYNIFYPVGFLRDSLSNAYHGVLDTYFNALVDKTTLKDDQRRLDRQYIHAIGFMEVFALIRFKYDFKLEGFLK